MTLTHLDRAEIPYSADREVPHIRPMRPPGIGRARRVRYG